MAGLVRTTPWRRAVGVLASHRTFFSVVSSQGTPVDPRPAKGVDAGPPEEGDVRPDPDDPTRWQSFKLNRWRWKCGVDGCLRTPQYGAFKDGVPRRCAFHARLLDCELKNSIRIFYGAGFGRMNGSWRVAVPKVIDAPSPTGWISKNRLKRSPKRRIKR